MTSVVFISWYYTWDNLTTAEGVGDEITWRTETVGKHFVFRVACEQRDQLAAWLSDQPPAPGDSELAEVQAELKTVSFPRHQPCLRYIRHSDRFSDTKLKELWMLQFEAICTFLSEWERKLTIKH